MSKHTEGPWTRTNLTVHTPTSRAENGGGHVIARVYDLPETEAVDSVNQATANADLIAAAPELAEALQQGARCPVWVHNAALTDDIDALRRIALWWADWANNWARPALAKIEGSNR